MGLRINVGCGQTPVQGWKNFDNSPSLLLSKIPILPSFLYKFKLLSKVQFTFIRFARCNNIEYGDVRKKLPLKCDSVEVFYTSHMLEHLDRRQATQFCNEAFRVLQPGGIVRVVIPDIKKNVDTYIETGDADTLVEKTGLAITSPKSIVKKISLLLFGHRNHLWMYDGNSLCKLLVTHGFINTEILSPGMTKIKDHLPLNLTERASESVFVEAEKPEH